MIGSAPGSWKLTDADDEISETGGNGASGVLETAAGEPAEARDGTWVVGDAGEIEFTLQDDGLALDDVRPNQGWESRIDEHSPEEIKVDFERGNVEWQIEVQTRSSELEIEIDQTIEPAEPGAYEIADAGTVEIATEGGSLNLVDASANEGWNVSVEETAEEIQADFARNGVRWDFDAELDDGELGVGVDQDITGPLPN